MKWRPLSERLDTLSLVLAGPILRRVENNSVSVWLALKEHKRVRLMVYAYPEGTLMFSSEPESSADDTETPVKIGSKLHIICVTAKPRDAERELQSGKVYTYDIEFEGGELLGNVVQTPLSYGIGAPSFVLPAADRTKLRISQGSCRKTHGPDRDALAILDTLIERNHTDPETRPQLLVFTGDQIYADDVADALLHMIMDAAQTLLPDRWNERIDVIGNLSNPELRPGKRASAVRDCAEFTTGAKSDVRLAKSHLLGLGEYILMHLFVWSDVLWDDDLPDYKTTTGNEEKKIYNYFYGPPGSGMLRAEEVDHPWLARFATEFELLKKFQKDLQSVRRALANIPTYMIFDDHEVTDDWNLNARWCDQVLNRPAGRQIISNALTAYALCQAWGNTPNMFLPDQNGGALFAIVNSGYYLESPNSLEYYFLPAEGNILDEQRCLNQPEFPIQWHFSIDYEAFQLVVLDSRTHRQFRHPLHGDDDTWAPVLINDLSLKQQIGGIDRENRLCPFTKDFVILVFPPPLIGIPVIEWIQAKESDWLGRLERDWEAPGLQPYGFERFLSRVASAIPTDVNLGHKYGNVILLTGDVHYGFAFSLYYQSALPFMEETLECPANICIHQFTASALKNVPEEWYLRKGLREYTSSWAAWMLKRLGQNKPFQAFIGFRDINSKNAVRAAIQPGDWLPSTWGLDEKQIHATFLDNYMRAFLIDELGRDSQGFRVDLSYISDSSLVHKIKGDWAYQIYCQKDERDSDKREGNTEWNALTVGSNNLGVLSMNPGQLVFELWWYVDESSVPNTAATQYLIPITT